MRGTNDRGIKRTGVDGSQVDVVETKAGHGEGGLSGGAVGQIRGAMNANRGAPMAAHLGVGLPAKPRGCQEKQGQWNVPSHPPCPLLSWMPTKSASLPGILRLGPLGMHAKCGRGGGEGLQRAPLANRWGRGYWPRRGDPGGIAYASPLGQVVL